jgi:hypothetical protein
MPKMFRVPLYLLVFAVLLCAQNAELSGVITDPAGLAVTRARVVVGRVGTGAIREVSPNQQGEYSVAALLPGAYNVTVESTGFATLPYSSDHGL